MYSYRWKWNSIGNNIEWANVHDKHNVKETLNSILIVSGKK
ncbi:hypothetical protein LEP1GSC188_4669 [Leptospira weilii serovar Topaz str. LT2116]|uniref:Uncharacterized protein n=1 Tax=Leptospira weilii serovar Topaz str. LT2116 TaxID=1088540 RepID=M3FKP0_9LEPT|nr:hypothetical protein LEP1GSC188_4669 [Leptospira weilii serovar Topaz str. LT2116]